LAERILGEGDVLRLLTLETSEGWKDYSHRISSIYCTCSRAVHRARAFLAAKRRPTTTENANARLFRSWIDQGMHSPLSGRQICGSFGKKARLLLLTRALRPDCLKMCPGSRLFRQSALSVLGPRHRRLVAIGVRSLSQLWNYLGSVQLHCSRRRPGTRERVIPSGSRPAVPRLPPSGAKVHKP
jgi:hypothetical protein